MKRVLAAKNDVFSFLKISVSVSGKIVFRIIRYRPKGVFGKAPAIARMRQKCVRSAPKMLQNH